MTKNKIIIGCNIFNTQKACEDYTRSILVELGCISSVKSTNIEYFKYLVELGKRHPDYDDKFRNFNDFKIKLDEKNSRGLELKIINNDNSETSISWKTCVLGKTKSINELFNSALRYSIHDQIVDFKSKADLSHCTICFTNFKNIRIHVDHIIQFSQLVKDFLNCNTIIKPTSYNKVYLTNEVKFKDEDMYISNAFSKYHKIHAKLRITCEDCNLNRLKKSNIQ
jgi:hypothetical protein